MQHLFDQTKGWDHSVNLTGEFVNTTKFEITAKWQLAQIKSFERMEAIIEGEVSQDELLRTQVIFTVKPNSIFAIFFLIFPAMFLLPILTSDKQRDLMELLPPMAISLLIVPSILLALAYFSKSALKNRFVRVFELKLIDEYLDR